jgi:hypothetical protein
MNKIIFIAIVASTALSAGKIQAQNAATSKKHIEHAKAWEVIYERDITEKHRDWSEIDSKASENKLFAYSRKSSRDVNLIDVLMNGIADGRIKAYADERFTKELNKDELHALLPKDYNPAAVGKYHIKEDRINASTLKGTVIRIVGLGPILGDGKEPLFWVYYPEARKVLAESNVNCNDYDTPITWDDVMEQRLFSAQLLKASGFSSTQWELDKAKTK